MSETMRDQQRVTFNHNSSGESATKKVLRMTHERMDQLNESFTVAQEAALLSLDAATLLQFSVEMMAAPTDSRPEPGKYAHLTPQQATSTLIELTRERMAKTGEKDFAKASYKVLEVHPELVTIMYQDEK